MAISKKSKLTNFSIILLIATANQVITAAAVALEPGLEYGLNSEIDRVRIRTNLSAELRAEVDQALIAAVQHSDLAAAVAALNAGADTEEAATKSRGFWDMTYHPLSLAVKLHNTEMVKMLLAIGAYPNHQVGYVKDLEFAVRTNDLEIVMALLAAGANPNTNNFDPDIAAITQASRPSSEGKDLRLKVEITKALLLAGADAVINSPILQQAVAELGTDNPILKAIAESNYGLKSKEDRAQIRVRLPEKARKNQDEKLAESLRGKKSYLRMAVVALNAGASPNSLFNEIPALIRAVRSNDPEVVKMMLMAGADPNFKDAGNVAPLTEAALLLRPLIRDSAAPFGPELARRVIITKELLAAGAEIDPVLLSSVYSNFRDYPILRTAYAELEWEPTT
ncbi:MAG TPA: hypothetical protein VJJ81_00910 [Candidatus Babeliales bacterium]|nr:hypothetical protein [Candidatus Babeliales bacterium]